MEATNNPFSEFLSSFDNELTGKVRRLDQIIGSDHWLSVGNYKESILRQMLSNSLPKRFEVSTGFIVASDRNCNPIKSKQIDIIIWDSFEHSPLFRDGEFVIVAPEACNAIIEVKAKLTRKELTKSLDNFDKIMGFANTNYPVYKNIRKYIFAFEIAKNLKFPDGIWSSIARAYGKSKFISLADRMKYTNHKDFWERGWTMFSLDALFVLPKGAIFRERKGSENGTKLFYEAFSSVTESVNHTYQLMEWDIQSHLADDRFQGLHYSTNPGLESVKRFISIEQTKPKSVMAFPPYEPNEKMHKNLNPKSLFIPKKYL